VNRSVGSDGPSQTASPIEKRMRAVPRALPQVPRDPRGALLWVAPFVVYALFSWARSDLRIDHIAVLALVATLAFASPRTNELLRGLYPIGLVFILYDGMRPYQRLGLTPERVLLCDLRAFEATLFGANGRTIHDYWQAHTSTTLDLICAIPYATFILWSALGGVWLYMKDRIAMRRFMWAFFIMNVAGFITYHVLPAAPPWYFHTHGCVVDLTTKATEGAALARVDALVGIPYFHGMYGKASSVFGALPSLHCAYPFLLAIVGWRSFGPKLRVASFAYYVLMVFSAVYLDHHWILDALLGTLYAVGAAFVMSRVLPSEKPVAKVDGATTQVAA
jgi:inositol phosphorylceramide synthase catalytic subunit